MGCLNIKPTVADVFPKFHIERAESTAGEQSFFYRDHFRVYYIVRGYVTVSVDNGNGLRLGYGDICILPPNLAHDVRVNTTSTDYYVFSFSIDFVEHILQHQAGTGGVLSTLFNSGAPVVIAPVPAEMQIHLQHLMDFMRHEYEAGLGSKEHVLRNCLATVFCVFLELLQAQQSVPAPSEKNGILFAIHYIKNNCAQKLTPDDMAKRVYMTKKEFDLRFKKFSGHSFHEFLNKVRIEKAIEILKKSHSEITLSELSWLCGYENYITFYRNFVKYTGLPPAEFADVSADQKEDE